jgi:plastocyanin
MNAHGFLGTNASVLSDLSLLFGLGVAVLLTIGVSMARRRKFAVHRWIQSTAVTLNLLQVASIMVGSFTRSAAPGVPDHASEPYYAVAIIHGVAGALTVLFGTFVALRANELVPGALRFHNFKLFMRTAYGAYMTVTVLGVGVYLTWYTGAPREAAPVATQANAAVVPMAGFAFNPAVTVVSVGSTVTWVNQDGAPHTATADDATAFQSDVLRKGQTFSFTFETHGEFNYYCELHGSVGGEGMAGTIKVVSAEQLPVAVAAVPPVVQPTPVPTTFVPDTRTLPQQSLAAIQRMLVDGPGLPIRQGYAVGLHDQSEELLRHAKLLAASQSSGDTAGVRRHAEHLFNLIAGSRDPQFGDLNDDGHSQNAGDGFGLLPNRDQPGYISATAEAAQAAENAADATPAIRLHAQHVQICASNLKRWATEARSLAFDLSRDPDAAAAQRLLQLANAISVGEDTNGDGEIAPVPGEGGGLVAYMHAQYMAGLVPATSSY